MIDKTKYNQVGTGVDRMWQPKGESLKVGASVEGRYIDKKTEQGPKNNSNVYVIEEFDGKTVGVWGGTVLDSRFRTIGIGKMVAIEYLGKKKTKDGSGSYNDFYVGVGIDTVGDEGSTYKRKKGAEEIDTINLDEEPPQEPF